MGITFRGEDGEVVLDDSTVRLVRPDDDGSPVVIPRSEISAVEVTRASLLGHGRLAILTRAGAQHTVRFGRTEQEHFDNLAGILRP